jgi:hypothetical protein
MVRKAKMTVRPWKGPLAEPVIDPGPSTPNPPDTILTEFESPQSKTESNRIWRQRYDDAQSRILSQLLAKLPLLLHRYNISEGEAQYVTLSLALAMEFVPGFRVIKKGSGRGRKNDTWPDGAYIGLLVDVEVTKARKNLKTDAAALRALLNETACKYNGNKKITHEGTLYKAIKTMNARLSEAKRLNKKLSFDVKCTQVQKIFGEHSLFRAMSFNKD